MGFKFQDDKIGSLSHSGGVISLAPSVLTIGGQQYRTLLFSTLTLPALSANTLYMIYAVLSGGVVTLVQSTNANSVGPAGYSAWKLVGAYMSTGDATPVWGSFVNIEGMPRSSLINGGLVKITADTTAPTKFASPTMDIFEYAMLGDKLVGTIRYAQETGGAAGSGLYFYGMPTNLSMNPNKSLATTAPDGANTSHQHVVGRGKIHVPNSSIGNLLLIPYDNSRFRLVTNVHTTGSIFHHGSPSSNYPFNLAQRIHCDLEVYVQGWSNSPLKDL